MTYELPQVLQALAALRQEAGLEPEQFPVEAFVGMISDEMDALHAAGKSDDDIVRIIQASSGIEIDAGTLRANYAPPELRHRPE